MTASEIPERLDDLQQPPAAGPGEAATGVLATIRAVENTDEDKRKGEVLQAVRELAESGQLDDEVTKLTVKDYIVTKGLLKAGEFNAVVRQVNAAREAAAKAARQVAQEPTAGDTAISLPLSDEPTLAEVLSLVLATLKRFIVFPSGHAAIAATLFAALTHVQPELQFAPRLDIRSPVKRCGKSRLFDLLVLLVHKALVTVNISAAAVVHAVTADDPPVIMLDEADRTFNQAAKGDEKSENLIGILNGGFERGRPYIRHDPAIQANREYPTFAMAVIAGIGKRPDTIEDRSVIITMQRKAAVDVVEKYRLRRAKPYVAALGRQLHKLVTPHAREIAEAEPEMPPGLNDRAEDTWEGLLAVADLAGGDWPNLARAAARNLSGEAEEDAAESQRLLSDLATVFTVWKPGDDDEIVAEGMHDKLHTVTIIEALCKIPEAPWSEFGKGKPITDRALAHLLGDYKVKSRDVKIGTVNRKGYRREDLYDAWRRYAPLVELPKDQPRPGEEPQQAELLADEQYTGPGSGATGATSATAQVNSVAPQNPRALPALPQALPPWSETVPDDQGPDLQGSAGSARPESSATALTSEVAPVALVALAAQESKSALGLLQKHLGAELIETTPNGHATAGCIAPGCRKRARPGTSTCWPHAREFEPPQGDPDEQ